MPTWRERRAARRQVAEWRDPKGATQALRFVGPGMAQVDEWDAGRAIRLGYHANIVAFRCIEIIADTLAARPFRAGAAQPTTTAGMAEANPDARLAALLGPPPGGPAPKLSAKKLWKWTVTQRKATGRGAWEIETDGDRVVALWPLVSANLKAIPTTGGTEWFSRYEYGRSDEPKKLSAEQVFNSWEPSASDFRQPFSPLQVARYALSVALQSDEYLYALLKNGAVPATVVGVEAFPEGDEGAGQFEALKRQWQATYGGPANAGRTHFLELQPGQDGKLSEALFVQTIGTSAKEGRFDEQHMAALQQIAISLGVPWSKLDASGRTYDNAAEEDRTFYESTVVPLATDLADDVNANIAERVGPEVGWFDFSDVRCLQPIPPADAQSIPALIMAGVCSPEEARPWLGLAGPAPASVIESGGGEPAALPEGADAAALPPGEPDDQGDNNDGRSMELGEADRRTQGGSGRGSEAQEARDQGEGGPQEVRATVDQEARRLVLWRSQDAVIRQLEAQFARTFRRLFARQAKSAVERLEGRSRVKAWEAMAEARDGLPVAARAKDLFDPAFWHGITEDEAEALFTHLSTAAFVRLSDKFGVSFDLEAEFAIDFIRTRANQLAGQVTDTTYRAIVDQLAEGVGEGESIPKLAARIRTVFSDASAVRATTIARTEVISGYGAATQLATLNLPPDVAAGLQWIATRDDRTRDEHAAADGQIVAVGSPFDVGGEALAYPGDPSASPENTVNCRCAMAALTPEEFAAEADTFAKAQADVPVPVARVALRMVEPGEFDEARFRRALEGVGA